MSILLALIFVVAAPASPLVDASKLTLSAPVAIVEIDTGKLKGELSRFSWSPDAQQVYLQTIERDKAGAIKTARHYLLAFDGKPPKSVDQEPAWSAAYWGWKSGQAAPGLSAFKIDAEQEQKRMKSTSTPMGGDLAKGGVEGGAGAAGAGMTTGDAMAAASQSQVVSVWTLKLKGEVIGEFVNTMVVPGLTFGWAPAGTGLIAFSNKDGRLVIMDDQGRKQEIASSKSALLPAWTDDGKRLAYLEKTGKNKAALKIVDVTRPQ